MKTRVPLLLSLVFAAACSDSSVTGPAPLGRVVLASTAAVPAVTRITVMTRNLYIGADVDQVITALVSGGDVLAALEGAVETVLATSYPARAEAMADEIARTRPQFVGLQEVTELHLDLSALGIPVIDQPFLTILEGALSARGLNYQLAGQNTNTAATLVLDRKSTRLNSSHSQISYAVFCLKKKKLNTTLPLARELFFCVISFHLI